MVQSGAPGWGGAGAGPGHQAPRPSAPAPPGMSAPDFDGYSLALWKEDRILFSSRDPGLAPLLVCIDRFRGRVRDCTLHDKVFGLAAARLAVWGGFVSRVAAGVASRPALAFLAERGIPVTAAQTTDNILKRDRSTVCPGEALALATLDDEVLIRRLRRLQKP